MAGRWIDDLLGAYPDATWLAGRPEPTGPVERLAIRLTLLWERLTRRWRP
jgi:hypothetical protein